MLGNSNTEDRIYCRAQNIDQVLNFIWEDSAKSEKCRRLMSARCREYAVEHFDKEEKYKSYMELYSEIINKCKL